MNIYVEVSGIADVCEWFDEHMGKHRIEGNVSNRRFGPLFGCRGSFDVEWRQIDACDVPVALKPRREEKRE